MYFCPQINGATTFHRPTFIKTNFLKMKIAVIGATGMVGEVMLKVLEERNFPIDELLLVASEKSIGKELEFRGKTNRIIGIEDAIAAKPNIALFSAGGATSLE